MQPLPLSSVCKQDEVAVMRGTGLLPANAWLACSRLWVTRNKSGLLPSACMALRQAKLLARNHAFVQQEHHHSQGAASACPGQATLFCCAVHQSTAVPACRDHGCHGGLMDFAFDFILQNGGLDTEKDYK